LAAQGLAFFAAQGLHLAAAHLALHFAAQGLHFALHLAAHGFSTRLAAHFAAQGFNALFAAQGFAIARLRWSHIVGQFSGLSKVYSVV
jgi:hypothetical protein